jgi:transcriptional regulator
MYIPAHFSVQDLSTLHDFVEHQAFGTLISRVDGHAFATHLPFLLDRTASANGVLLGHVARANPQWRELAGHEALCIFNGPHAYISPTWYAAEKVVPTWNYVAVHAYGRVELVEEPAALIEIIQKLTRTYEQNLPTPWEFDRADPFIQKLANGIVGFRIAIERIEGKWKLNQNHPEERRRRVVDALRDQDGEDANEIARLIEMTCPGA